MKWVLSSCLFCTGRNSEGLRGWLWSLLMSGAAEMEPEGPGYKVSAHSWLLSSVVSDIVFII